MLPTISNVDTLDSLSVSNGQTALTAYYILGVVAIGFTVFLIKRRKSVKNIQKQPPNITNPERTTITKSAEIKAPPTKSQIPKTEIKQEKEVKKEDTKATEVKRPDDKKTKEKVPSETVTIPEAKIIKPEKEEQSKEKYIGYNPINIFAQTEPLNYPYVIMPKPNCVIKFPRKGRVGRTGHKEVNFRIYIERYFKNNFQVYDDRLLLIKNSPKPFVPDFTLIDEKEGINIFLDIEIDEPYEGLNDVNKRKTTHFQYSDANRNNAFKNRGWIVIRFAEIQVHQEPDSCCRFIADVLKSVNRKYNIPENLSNHSKVKSIRQWTKEEAEQWSIEKYREKYLGITSFGLTVDGQILTEIEETELGDRIEIQVKDDEFIPIEVKTKTPNTKLEKIYSAINSNKYLSFYRNNEKTIVKPIRTTETELTVLCYVKNRELTFSIYEIKDLQIKDSYFTLRLAGPIIGLDKISSAVNIAINYHKLIRMKYTRAEWTTYKVDKETGEIIIADRIEAKESIRTISNIQLAINDQTREDLWFTPDERHITAYCHRREAERMFRFDRVGEIEILDI